MKYILFALLALSTSAFAQNTITTNSPVQTSFCAGGNIVVQYTSTGTYALGCTFTAELSDAMGNFSNPIVVGSMPFNTGIIAGTIPSNTSFGFNYRVRVVASNPYTVGSVSPLPPLIITSTAVSASIVANPSSEICQGDTVSLWVSYNESYFWSTGETTQTINVTNDGTYTVTVTNYLTGCEVTSNPIDVTVHPKPIVNFGSDIELCDGQNTSLNAGSGYSNYNWNTGYTAQTLNVNQTGNYSVIVTDGFGCKGGDTIQILVHPNPMLNLGADTVFCGNSLLLSAGTGFSSYNWNNGLSFNPTFNVETSGIYSVSITDANNCTNADTISVALHPLPIINLGNDLSACGNSIVLNAGNGYSSYNWNNGLSINQYLPVHTTGSYSVNVTNQFGCNAKDTIIVTINTLPDVNLGLDVQLALNNSIILDAGSGYLSYQWNSGQTTQTIQINGWDYPLGSISFTVSVIDANGCFNTDQIIVTIVQSQDINEVSMQNFEIFPVPFNDFLNVTYNQDLSFSKPVLTDMLGRYYYPEFTVNNSNMIINRGNLSQGYYMLFINNGKELVVAGKIFID